MRKGRALSLTALPVSVALAVAGCGGGGDSGSGSGANNETHEVSVHGTEPENPLVPGNTTETGGSKIIDMLFTGLTEYDPVTNETKMANAERVDITPDGKKMTVVLKKGWKFHDNTDVKADNYVNAWNYTANSKNGQQGSSFFDAIAGYDDVHTSDPDEDGPQKAPEPKSDKMSGLKKVDDYQFTVDFTESHGVFKLKIGYGVYSPLPDSFFKDPKAFEEKPIGNGPFKFTSRVPGREVKVERFEEYQGAKPKIKKAKFDFGKDLEAGYAAVRSNELDFIDTVAPSKLVNNLYKTELKDRNGNQDNLAIQIIVFPLYDKKFSNADFRKSISMAINRQEITEKVFAGTRKPVKGYGIPGLPGWSDGGCGEFCEYNPQKAKELFEKSGYQGAIEITSNADGGHREWATAACGQIRNALGRECNFVPVQTFGEMRQKTNAHSHTAIYRGGWQADYPYVENFLNPLYKTGGSSNDGAYSNRAVDTKLAEGDVAYARSQQEADKLYHEAEGMIANDMPAIPLWNTSVQYGWSNKLKNVRMTPQRELDLLTVEVA
ncbi:oligopeptide transport system substrate-binding protein [Herbihabitans rhizosphaerae]|uniref:Oligopeptide transport system substrate-binding protein n=1 Tax=Herbihabitans rhizosphaerae TaxID=1872711 RepID=A0A4Q7KN50_9PSEU|nr:ABC transporter substrate-binding protein [Herbihabitans rhizosphaerae]RZS37051.1 oligopeptide transport system substrate-binding protein [Herbihabitans rhizosphaerae]